MDGLIRGYICKKLLQQGMAPVMNGYIKERFHQEWLE